MRAVRPCRWWTLRRSFAGWGLPLALGLALAPAASAAPPPSAAPVASGAPWAGHPAIVTAGATAGQPGQVWLETPSGERALVPAPPRARMVAAERLTGGGWVAAGTEPAREGTEILLVAAADAKISQLPPPPRRGGGLRREPLPLVADGRLAGLVWLEGASPRTLAVRYASWDGSGWQDEQLISPPGPGSQLALTAARLADDSWLLAWSAFDGTADQIVWSARQGRTWTPPRALTSHAARSPRNAQAPNITPDLAPLPASQGGGALIAWSRLEGSGDAAAYRVMTARFAGGRWQEPVAAGPPGSLYPSFAAAADPARLHLLYRAAAPGGWGLLDLAASGRPQRAAFAADADRAVAEPVRVRPLPSETAGGVLFRWPAAGGERFVPWSQPSPPEPVR